MSNRTVVLTISDRCTAGDAVDRSGPTLIDMLPDLDGSLVHRELLPDELPRIQSAVRAWVDRAELVLLTGGTGVAVRDVTPEAVRPLIERELPGFGEVMRMRAFERVPLAVVSRGGAGIAGKTLIWWLPGSPKAARECVEWLAPAAKHVCAFLRGEAPH